MLRIWLAGAALLALVTACDTTPAPSADPASESSADSSATVPSHDAAADEQPPVASYRTWLQALAAQDAGAACAQHAPAFTVELRQRAILEHRAELGDPCVDFVAVLWEDPAVETDPIGVEVTQLTEEDALLAVDFPTADQTVRMIQRHGGQWYVESTTDREQGDAAARWVAQWCDLDPSLSREEIISRMGEPSGEYTVENGGEPQLWWALGPYDFRAYLEADGSVAELVGDYDALSAADRAQLDCPELRVRGSEATDGAS